MISGYVARNPASSAPQNANRYGEYKTPCRKAIISNIVATDVYRTIAVAFTCLIDGLRGGGVVGMGCMYHKCVAGDLYHGGLRHHFGGCELILP